MKDISMAAKAKIVWLSHSPFMVSEVFIDDGWTGNNSKEVFKELEAENYEFAAQLLVVEGWKGEVVY